MKYKILDYDEVVKVKFNQAPFSIRLTCCDCGLTHDVKILKYGSLAKDEVEMIFNHNRRSTTIHRKKRMETIKSLCSDCIKAVDCPVYLEILRNDNEREVKYHPKVSIMQVVFKCEHYRNK